MFEANFLNNLEESNNKDFGGTQPHSTKQYAKERTKLACNKSNKSYEISTTFRETPCPHNI